MFKTKKGVSLITVLLFMLVATIAGTATFKWLTSENFSSGSRMQQAQARSAAVAGIEAARSWMSNNANDAGAALKQYLADKKAISLDQVLATTMRGDQKYSVKIVGVEADPASSTLRVKVVSSGEARNGSVYSEAAILKVTGLYKVKVPIEVKPLDFHQSYYGGSTSSTDGVKSESMIINGDWGGANGGNPSGITKDFVVTGNVKLSGNNLKMAQNNCVGGNLSVENNGASGGNLYVENTTGPFTGNFTGNVYFNGTVNLSNTNPGFSVGGNLTLNGTFNHPPQQKTTINGNMCLTNSGKVNLGSLSSQNEFKAKGGAWIPNENGLSSFHDVDKRQYITLGSSADSKLYIKGGVKCDKYYEISKNGNNLHQSPTSTYCYKDGNKPLASKSGLLGCPSDGDFPMGFQKRSVTNYAVYYSCSCKGDCEEACKSTCTKNGQGSYAPLNQLTLFTTYGEFQEGNVSGEPKIECAESAKNYCDGIWKVNTISCPNGKTSSAKYMVPEMVQTAYDKFNQYANKSTNAAGLLNASADIKKNSATKFSEYYQNALSQNGGKGILYNDYLVVKGSANEFSGLFPQEGAGTLIGKFIFIVEGSGFSAKLPVTGSDSYVMFYLPDGAETIGTTNAVGARNYFFYSLNDIKTLMHNAGKNEDRIWNGSFYFPQNSCAGITSMTMAEQQLKVNENLLDDLSSNNVLCAATATTCGGIKNADGGEATNGYTADGYDADFVAIGSQITVVSESQYKSTETFNDSENLKPSALVMPRVIYLNKDPVGKLSDYYDVIHLNGAALAGSGEVSCEGGSIPTSGNLFDGSNYLSEGTFVCNYQESDANGLFKSFFYVHVSGLTAENPPVSFVGNATEQLTSMEDHEVYVSLRIDGASGTPHEFSVDIALLNDDVDWVVDDKLSASLTKRTGSAGGAVYTYTGTTMESAQVIRLFKINTTVSSKSGGMTFVMQTPRGCTISTPNTKQIQIQGISVVERHELKEYCESHEGNSDCSEENLKRPSCEKNVKENVWVVAHASEKSCNTENPNSAWRCYTDPAVTLSPKFSAVPSYCSVVIPTEDNTAVVSSNDQTYVLYGSILGKKYSLNIEVKGVDHGGYVSVCKAGETDCEECDSENCSYEVFGGEHYVLTAKGTSENGDVFNYWSCESQDCSFDLNTDKTQELHITGDNSVIAMFNKRDEHCFYDDFTKLSPEYCKANEEKCVRQCTSNNGPCEIAGNADWQMIFNNSSAVPKNKQSNLLLDDGFLSFLNDKNGESKNGSQTILLRNALAGPDGVLSALIHTKNGVKDGDFVNSGFIFRSDSKAEKYLILNVYGNKNNELTARICRGEGQGIPNSNAGTCGAKVFTKNGYFGPNHLNIDNTSVVKIKAHILGNKLDVEAFVGENQMSLQFDLSVAQFSDLKDNSYVGVAMSHSDFHLLDIGWASETYGGDCFDVPQLKCSFGANYLGGIVPLAEDVKPWVGVSSWYDQEECSYEYFYNGCDNAYSSCSSVGMFPGGDGAEVSNGLFNFSEQGLHGTLGAEGTLVKNVNVKINCSSNDQKRSSYESEIVSCGTFRVGDVQTCFANEALLSSNSPKYGFAGNPVEILFEEKNLRDANLVVNVSSGTPVPNFVMPTIPKIDVTLTDKAGISAMSQITGIGFQSISVNSISNINDFDPQHVVKITLSSSGPFNVSGIQSECPHVMNMSCENSSVRYVNGVWQFALDVNNAEECSVKPALNSNSLINEQKTSCEAGNDGKVHIAVEENLGTLYSATEYKFTVTSTAANQSAQSCDLTATVEPGTSGPENPPAVDCNNVLNCIWGDMEEIELGESFTFYGEWNDAADCSNAELVRTESRESFGTGCVGSQVITPTSKGKHTYEYRGVTASACGKKQYSCTKKINVVEKKGGSSGSDSYCSTTNIKSSWKESLGTTDAVCYKIKADKVDGCNFSNVEGRTLKVNGSSVKIVSGENTGGFNAASDGYIYFDFSSGAQNYAGFSCWPDLI